MRALLIVKCGMVEGREGSFPTARPQLLVYDADGKLEVLAGLNNAATLNWKNSVDGPKLAGGFVTGTGEDGDLKVEALTAVATK